MGDEYSFHALNLSKLDSTGKQMNLDDIVPFDYWKNSITKNIFKLIFIFNKFLVEYELNIVNYYNIIIKTKYYII